MNILVDTSVWIDHFRSPRSALTGLLYLDLVLVHPMIVCELACGTPPAPRLNTLKDIGTLRSARQATLPEVLNFIESNKLFGLGCGLVDMVILASTLITPDAKLWTLDKRLASLAERMNILYTPIEP